VYLVILNQDSQDFKITKIESGFKDDDGLKDEPLILMIFSDFYEHKNQCNQKHQRNPGSKIINPASISYSEYLSQSIYDFLQRFFGKTSYLFYKPIC